MNDTQKPKQRKVEVPEYYLKCPFPGCEKGEVTGTTVSQCNHNFNVHYNSHFKDEDKDGD